MLPPSNFGHAARPTPPGRHSIVTTNIVRRIGGGIQSRKVIRLFVSPACIAGVRRSCPNSRARCGRAKLQWQRKSSMCRQSGPFSSRAKVSVESGMLILAGGVGDIGGLRDTQHVPHRTVEPDDTTLDCGSTACTVQDKRGKHGYLLVQPANRADAPSRPDAVRLPEATLRAHHFPTALPAVESGPIEASNRGDHSLTDLHLNTGLDVRPATPHPRRLVVACWIRGPPSRREA